MVVASTTTAFAKAGETSVNAAGRHEMSGKKVEASFEELIMGSCSIETYMVGSNGDILLVTTTTHCTCSDVQACAIAGAAHYAFIAVM